MKQAESIMSVHCTHSENCLVNDQLSCLLFVPGSNLNIIVVYVQKFATFRKGGRDLFICLLHLTVVFRHMNCSILRVVKLISMSCKVSQNLWMVLTVEQKNDPFFC
uniref:Uncharacterized protein n=1 Tax=Cacopsylla melanoneura TaxID=428564 RepID=A0A8D8ZC36_9HEMI